jgi:hypothetical protein
MNRKMRRTRPVSWKLSYEIRQYSGSFFERTNDSNSLLPAIVVTECRETSKCTLASDHRVGEDHQQATHNREVAEEEVDVEDESVAETLNEDDTQETSHRNFRVPLHDDARGPA